MKVREVMTRSVRTCTPATDLATAAMIMWWTDCGVVPVVDGDGDHVCGMITDRDICMAAATRHCSPDQIRVSDVIGGSPITVTPEAPIHTALQVMAGAQVRRVPVVERDGTLVGLLSLNDIALKVDTLPGRSRNGLSGNEIVRTLKAISQHRRAEALEETEAPVA